MHSGIIVSVSVSGCMARDIALGRLVVHMGFELELGSGFWMLLSGNVIPDVIVVRQVPALM